MSKFSIRNVSYIYSAGTPYEMKALDNVSAEIAEGKITGLIGHTGSGKSTLVQMLNGLEKPTSGQILLDGRDIFENPKELYKLRFRVGLVMQYPEYQLFEETVFDDIAFGPRNMELDEDEVRRRVNDAVGFVGLEKDILDKSPFDLSGGQKRRVAIAGIIAMDPEVLVLDEPAAGLDPSGRDTIFEGISHYQQKTKKTIVIVSHSMEDMAKYCDELIVMSGAKICMSGRRDEVFSRSVELSEVGLDVPQITQLMMHLRDMGVDVGYGVYTVDAAYESIKKLFE